MKFWDIHTWEKKKKKRSKPQLFQTIRRRKSMYGDKNSEEVPERSERKKIERAQTKSLESQKFHAISAKQEGKKIRGRCQQIPWWPTKTKTPLLSPQQAVVDPGLQNLVRNFLSEGQSYLLSFPLMQKGVSFFETANRASGKKKKEKKRKMEDKKNEKRKKRNKKKWCERKKKISEKKKKKREPKWKKMGKKSGRNEWRQRVRFFAKFFEY